MEMEESKLNHKKKKKKMERLRVKLLIDGGASRVAFAEADKSLVDFLFRILSLPIADALALVGEGVGSLTSLRGSLADLGCGYLMPKARESLLTPPPDFSPAPANPGAEKLLYGCLGVCYNLQVVAAISDDPRAVCPICRTRMTKKLSLVGAAGGGGGGDGGCVRGLVTYMVMDDLTVVPMSVEGMKKANFKKSVAELEEKIVFLGKEEAVKLLRASLHSKNVLTDVYLKDSNVTNGRYTASGVKRERTS